MSSAKDILNLQKKKKNASEHFVLKLGLFKINCASAGKWMRSGSSSRGGAKQLRSSQIVSQKSSVCTGSHRNTHILFKLILIDLNFINSLHTVVVFMMLSLSTLYTGHLLFLFNMFFFFHKFSHKSSLF